MANKGDYTNNGIVSIGSFVSWTPGTTPTAWPKAPNGAFMTTRMVVVGTAGTMTVSDMYGNTALLNTTAGDHYYALTGITTPASATGITLGF